MYCVTDSRIYTGHMANPKPPLLKRGSTAFLQGVIVLVGMGALAFMLTMPHFEGRNAHATPFEVYFKDPFLAYVYVGSIPFFVALFCGLVMLGEVFILMNESDDRAGGVAMGVFLIFGSIVIATAAATFEHVLQKAVDLKSESDLTV